MWREVRPTSRADDVAHDRVALEEEEEYPEELDNDRLRVDVFNGCQSVSNLSEKEREVSLLVLFFIGSVVT